MNIAVYCGANEGNRPEYGRQAKALGKWIGENGHRLIYGGGRYGMMGLVADAVLAAGGEAIGVTPDYFIKNELTHEGLTELIKVENLAVRRLKMIELADVCVALPGGIGTLDEISEVMCNNRLKSYVKEGTKPAVLFNTCGFYDSFVELLNHMVAEGYYDQEDMDDVIVANSIEDMELACARAEQAR